MRTLDFLNHLKTLDIQVRVDGERLICEAPKGAITAELSAEIRDRKPELINFLSQANSKGTVDDFMLQPMPRHELAPLSFAQQRFWFVDQITEELSVNNIPEAWRLTGLLDTAALNQALNEIVSRHEILRTHVEMIGQDVVPRVHSEVTVSVPLVDLSHLSHDQKAEQLSALFETKKQEVIDLSRAPLWNILLIKLGAEEHVLFFMPHHIIWDGWSWDVLCEELSELYSAFSEDKPSPLQPLPLQYGDFARWQRSWVTENEAQRQLDYWSEHLRGALPILQLPTDHPRPAVMTYRGGAEQITVPHHIAASVRQLAQEFSATPFMVYLAAFKVLLYRYSTQEDLIVGSPIQGRTLPNVGHLIGPFVNTIALRTQLASDLSFQEVIKRVRHTCLDAYTRQDIPFDHVVDKLDPIRDPSRTPIYQALFSYENIQERSASLGALTRANIDIDMPSIATDISVSLVDSRDGVTGHFEYYADVYSPEMIARLCGSFQRLLTAVVLNPEALIGQLPLLADSEREQLLVGWNQTARPIPENGVMHRLIERQADRMPEHIAVACNGATLSYRELDERSNQLAHYLQKQGVGVGDLVGIYIDRSVDMIVGLLGILKAGGTYVPLDPSFPPDRIAYMIEDAQMPVILTQASLVNVLPATNLLLICLDTDWARIKQERSSRPDIDISGDDLAYVIYTSGSTGQPKGVQLPHRAVTNFLLSMSQEPGLHETDTLLAVTTLSFDIAVLELFLPLSVGGKVVIASRSAATDGGALLDLIEHYQVSVMQATPTTWRLMINAGWSGNDRLKVLCGGEAMPPDLAENLVGLCGELWNMYGPTETTVWSTVYRVQAETANTILIGRPISNTEIYILNEGLQPVPVGVAGTLYIGGHGLAKGYLHRPELTAEKFIPHPFKPAGRLYNTGDLARYRLDAQIECLGRMDNQVKLRGYRIELGEIEALMAQYEGINEAAAAIQKDQHGDDLLVGYLTEQDHPVRLSELRAFLKAHLPDYMVPGQYMRLVEMPLTPNRKIDRNALPEPVNSENGLENGADSAYVAPTTELEQQLVHIWERVLPTRPIGIRDNFFDLGGHSLLAVRLFNLIKQEITQEMLPLATLFQAPSIQQFAALIQDQGWERPWTPLVPIQTTGSKPPLFCIHAAGGNVLGYRDLARYLKDVDQPVYGLQSQGLDGEQPILETVEEMAALYVKAIQVQQPHGPYLLAGYCLGGTIALEMAQQLHAQGQDVALVGMFETYNWANTKDPSTLEAIQYQSERVEFHVRNFLMLDGSDKRSFLQEKARVARERSSLWYGKLKNKLRKDQAIEPQGQTHLARLWEINDLAAFNYVPARYPGKITSFLPIKEYSELTAENLSWHTIAQGGVDECRLAVYPAGMLLEPFVKELATQLTACIDKALVTTP